MNISPVLLYIWGALFVTFMALIVYRGQLTRYEDERLFLDDEAVNVQRSRERSEQVLQKLSRLRPILNSLGVAAGLVTATVVSLYVYDAWRNIP